MKFIFIIMHRMKIIVKLPISESGLEVWKRWFQAIWKPHAYPG